MIKKILIGISGLILLTISLLVILYSFVAPSLVSNTKFISFVEKETKNLTGIDLYVKYPVLKTGLSPKISFKAYEIKATKNGEQLLNIENLDTQISLKEIFRQRIILDRFMVKYIFADVNKLLAALPAQEDKEKQTPSNWSVDFYDSVLALKKGVILYNIAPDTLLKVEANDMFINNTKKYERFVHFNIDTSIEKSGKTCRSDRAGYSPI